MLIASISTHGRTLLKLHPSESIDSASSFVDRGLSEHDCKLVVTQKDGVGIERLCWCRRRAREEKQRANTRIVSNTFDLASSFEFSDFL